MSGAALPAPAPSRLRRAISAWPLWLALLALGVALLRPTLPWPRDTWQHVVVFDLTQSMNVEDQSWQGVTVSRFEHARDALRQVLPELPCGSRLGFGAFAEYRTILLLAPIEVCENYHDLLATLDRIDPRMRWGNASEVTKGTFWALRTVKSVEPRPDLIFFTDGQEAPPLSTIALPLFDDLRAGEVRGWILGTGSMVPQPIPRSDAEGRSMGVWRAEEVVQAEGQAGQGSREHLSSLREGHLRDVARLVGLGYARFDDLDAVRAALLDPRLARRQAEPEDLSALPTLLALLLVAWQVRPTWRRASAGAGDAPRRTAAAPRGPGPPRS